LLNQNFSNFSVQPVPYRDIVIQDLVIRTHNTRYRLARWLTPKGDYLIGELPAHLTDHHFGTTLRSYLLFDLRQ
jgi:hypothetical protein